MSVALFFTLIGGIILAGFFANLLFRLTRVPSVLLLIAMGVVLGPVTGIVRSDAFLDIAPLFGALALLIILFEGGLELEIGHVLREAPRTTLLAVLVFGLSFVTVAAFARWLVGLPLADALLLGAILAATSPAICMPVVAGLSVRNEVKTIVKLESALGEVLLIVAVILLIDSQTTGEQDALGWLWSLIRSLLVALAVSSVAGVLWSRLVGWMGKEPLAYMLTLSIVCLQYVAVEELGGSPAIATLLFGLILANMQTVAGRFGSRLREAFGLDVREEQFALDQFMLNITAELSFLVRTFFFVYLGLLLDFSTLSWALVGWSLGIFALLVASRRVGVGVLSVGVSALRPAEASVIMALLPRGLATAVVALLPQQAGIPGAEILPQFAFVIIVLSNVYMTGGVLLAERRLRLSEAGPAPPETPGEPAPVLDAGVRPGPPLAESRSEPVAALSPLSPASDFADEPPPARFTDWMARVFGLRRADREAEYEEMIRASYLSEPLFWVQTLLGAAICALGLILDQAAIVIGGALIVPLVRPVIASGLALASGDVYLLLKLMAKMLVASALVVLLSAFLLDALPFGAITPEIAARTRPTVLDFLVAFLGGMSGVALISLRRRVFHYLPGAVIGITLLPPLCVMGFGLGGGLGAAVFRGGGLLFTANAFAAVLGAGLVLVLVGIPEAADCASVRQWKEQELARPAVQAVFGRLGLQRVAGRTGSVRARLLVVAVFLLSILTPLQFALGQLTEELRVRQAVAQAQTLFEVPGRSVVLQSTSTLGGGGVAVRIQVATNEPFSADEIRRFEERVSDRSGRRTRLDLVQTLGDVGQADAIRERLAASERAEAPAVKSVADLSRELEGELGRLLGEIPLPGAIAIAAVRADITEGRAPRLELTYLAEAPLGGDAAEILSRLIAQRVGVEAKRITLRFVPSVHPIRVSRRGRVRETEPGLAALVSILAREPELAALLEPPAGLTPEEVDGQRQQLLRLLALPEERLRVSAPGEDRTVCLLRLETRASP